MDTACACSRRRDAFTDPRYRFAHEALWQNAIAGNAGATGTEAVDGCQRITTIGISVYRPMASDNVD
jgi:hypothetical protein